MKELFEKFGILSMKEDITKAEDPAIPFSKYDTCDTMTTIYRDGRTPSISKYYHRKISTKFQRVNEIMTSWGFHWDKEYKNNYRKLFTFLHQDYRMPCISIEYNNIVENRFKIEGIWAWDNCYFDESLLEENIMAAISWHVKDHKDLVRDIKLRKILAS